MKHDVILAGDVGGTKVALALVEDGEGGLRIVLEARYATQDFDGLVPAVERFLQGRFRDLLERVPVRVIVDPKVPLLGAARCAALAYGG